MAAGIQRKNKLDDFRLASGLRLPERRLGLKALLKGLNVAEVLGSNASAVLGPVEPRSAYMVGVGLGPGRPRPCPDPALLAL